MTYKEYFEQIKKDCAEKSDAFLKIESQLSSVNGFGDLHLINKLRIAKVEWQEAINIFYDFLFMTTKFNINPDDIMTDLK